jgi:hypothetical protein
MAWEGAGWVGLVVAAAILGDMLVVWANKRVRIRIVRARLRAGTERVAQLEEQARAINDLYPGWLDANNRDKLASIEREIEQELNKIQFLRDSIKGL